MGDHFDTDTLADHTEGLLEPARDAHVRAHIEWCTECNGVVEQLNSVRTVLSSLPEPSMPDDVVARIDASLSQAQSERAATTPADRSAEQPRRRSWLSGLFHRPGLLAGAAVLVVGFAFVGGYLSTQGSESGAGDSPNAAPSISEEPMVTGRDYTTANLAEQARDLVTQKQSGNDSPDPQASKTLAEEMQRLTDPAALDGCASAVTGGDISRVLAVDLGEFNQKPAAIVVMSTEDAGTYEVAAVGPGCSKDDAKIIVKRDVPRQ